MLVITIYKLQFLIPIIPAILFFAVCLIGFGLYCTAKEMVKGDDE